MCGSEGAVCGGEGMVCGGEGRCVGVGGGVGMRVVCVGVRVLHCAFVFC